MTKKEESPLFVGVMNGGELRRSMLECSKDILESLKEHEKFKNIKGEKVKLISQLKNDVKGIAKLINSLKNSLPNVRDAGIKRPETKKATAEKLKKESIEKPREKTELEKLEDELRDIENKLGSLS